MMTHEAFMDAANTIHNMSKEELSKVMKACSSIDRGYKQTTNSEFMNSVDCSIENLNKEIEILKKALIAIQSTVARLEGQIENLVDKES